VMRKNGSNVSLWLWLLSLLLFVFFEDFSLSIERRQIGQVFSLLSHVVIQLRQNLWPQGRIRVFVGAEVKGEEEEEEEEVVEVEDEDEEAEAEEVEEEESSISSCFFVF